MNLNFIKPIATFTIIILISMSHEFANETIVDKPVVEKTEAKVVDSKQLACMARNIYYEAGNESIKGQSAVARVVINRVNHGFAKTPCDVVYQSRIVERIVDDESVKVKLCQFSWVCEGKDEPNKNSHRYKQAHQVAYDVMANDAYNDVLPKSALFFHNLTVDPLWPYKQVAKIGNHIFYSRAKKSTQNNSTKTENNI